MRGPRGTDAEYVYGIIEVLQDYRRCSEIREALAAAIGWCEREFAETLG